MKIALIGYGKMGHMIEEIALQRGHVEVRRHAALANLEGRAEGKPKPNRENRQGFALQPHRFGKRHQSGDKQDKRNTVHNRI